MIEYIISAQELDGYSGINTVLSLRRWKPTAISAHGINGENLWIARVTLPSGEEFEGTDVALPDAFRRAMAKAEEFDRRPTPVQVEDLL
jgi:hypothetical protein